MSQENLAPISHILNVKLVPLGPSESGRKRLKSDTTSLCCALVCCCVTKQGALGKGDSIGQCPRAPDTFVRVGWYLGTQRCVQGSSLAGSCSREAMTDYHKTNGALKPEDF